MRIIAGKHKGRRIELGKDVNDIRPTSDFAREAIFNILAHGKHGLNGHTFDGQCVLDVFCGTGAFGLEALSRGAAEVTFIDQSRDAIAVARQNAETLGETATTRFILADATRLAFSQKSYSLIFLDPPYFSNLISPTLKALNAGGWLDKDALIIIEHDEKETVDVPPGFAVTDERRYGRAMVKVLKVA